MVALVSAPPEALLESDEILFCEYFAPLAPRSPAVAELFRIMAGFRPQASLLLRGEGLVRLGGWLCNPVPFPAVEAMPPGPAARLTFLLRVLRELPSWRAR